jgi:hypothetical protein
MLETATKFILDLVLNNEEVKKFPEDLVTTSMQWIRSWFLIDDPTDPKSDPATKAVLEDASQPPETKKAAIEAKLTQLQHNPQFQSELKGQMQQYGIHIANSHNVLVGNTITATTVKVGDEVHHHYPPAATQPVSLTDLEKQGEEKRLTRLIQQRDAFQQDHDDERLAGERLRIQSKIDVLNNDINAIKSKLGL